VLTEPSDLDRRELAAALERHWGLRAVRLEYLAVGFGSHHWRALDADGMTWFVTADDLSAGFQAGPDENAAFAALARAFGTASFLRERAGLDFVVAPLRDGDGVILRRLATRYAVTVSPFVDGRSGTQGAYETSAERRQMGAVLGRLHAATRDLPPDLPMRDDFAIPSRSVLMEAVGDLDRRWTSGPYAKPTRRLLRAHEHDVAARLRSYDALADRVRARPRSWVVTHGEPHSANVIRAGAGRLLLIDWDTTRLAPRERDLRMVLDDAGTGWDEYVAESGASSLDPEAIELYREGWDLAEIAIYVRLFRRPHDQTDDTAKSWVGLTRILAP
jgi:spectinomycin phosphotransferase